MGAGRRSGPPLSRAAVCDCQPGDVTAAGRPSALPRIATPRVLGVDDWAWKQGHRYGTILGDLATHRVVALLPVRTAEALAAWRQAHPGVEIISRDRAGSYAEGARLGTPQAQQAAERWPLLRNLSEALTRYLEQHGSHLRTAWNEVTPPPAPSVEALPVPPRPNKAELMRQQRRRDRLHRYEQVLSLHQSGATQKQSAQQLAIDTQTIRRYLRTDTFPEMATRQRHTGVDRWMPYLEQRWAEGCRNAAPLWREIKEQGFRGGQTTIRQWMARLREPALPGGQSNDSLRQQVPPSPRQTTWRLLYPDRPRSPEQQSYCEFLLRYAPDLARVVDLAQRFLDLCHYRSQEGLESCLAAAKQTRWRSFAWGLERDQSAVEAAFRLPWSNGPVEGQVHRLKLLKRQGYGRAQFDLLKQRVLQAA
jgi:transposase